MPDLGLSAITRNPFPDWPHLHCCAPNHSKLQSSILPCNVKLKESYIQWGGCHIFTAVSHAKPYRLNVSVHWCILIEILTICEVLVFSVYDRMQCYLNQLCYYMVFFLLEMKTFSLIICFFLLVYQFDQILICQWASRTFSFEGSAPYIMKNAVAWKKPSFKSQNLMVWS